MPRSARWMLFVGLAILVFLAAVRNDVDVMTAPTPHGVSSAAATAEHLVLRKLYSIAAFTAVALSFTYASGRVMLLRVVVLMALYSLAIEGVQNALGSREGLAWNVADILMGGLGGALGSLAFEFRGRGSI